MQNITATDDNVCETETNRDEFIGINLSALITLAIANGILLLAIGLNWSKLRHNIVYVYLISCLLSVICLCFFVSFAMLYSVYHFDNAAVAGGLLQRFNKDDPTHVRVMRSWSFRRALTAAMVLIMEFNVATLIYAVGYNATFVGRTATPQPDTLKQQSSCEIFGFIADKLPEKIKKLKKRKKAALHLLPVWFIPLVLIIPTAIHWNCIDHCPCLPAYRSFRDACLPPEFSGTVCSRIYAPAIRSFAVVCSALYFITIIVMFALLSSVVRRFYKTHENAVRDAVEEESSNGHTIHVPTVSATVTETVPKVNPRKYTNRPKLHDTIKLLIALTVSVTISVSPMFLMFFYDIMNYSGPAPSGRAFNTAITITILHAVSLPIIMLRYMAGLRKACKDAILKYPCFTTTIVRRKRRTAVSNLSTLHLGNETLKSDDATSEMP